MATLALTDTNKQNNISSFTMCKISHNGIWQSYLEKKPWNRVIKSIIKFHEITDFGTRPQDIKEKPVFAKREICLRGITMSLQSEEPMLACYALATVLRAFSHISSFHLHKNHVIWSYDQSHLKRRKLRD